MRSISFVPSALLFLTACTGLLDGTDDTEPGDADVDADADSDADADFEGVTFTLSIPSDEVFDPATASVLVAVNDDSSHDEIDEVDSVDICDESTLTCTYFLEEQYDIQFALVLNDGNGGSTTKRFDESDLVSGSTVPVSWTLGGCLDPAWNPLSGERCVDPDSGNMGWVPGEYGLAPMGVYYEENDPEEICEADTHEEDSDGDGVKDWYLEGCGGHGELWVSGDIAYYDANMESTAYSAKIDPSLGRVEILSLWPTQTGGSESNPIVRQ